MRICQICSRVFENNSSLGGHLKWHKSSPSFEKLKKDATRKVWLLKEIGHQCESCGLKEWIGENIPLEIDHIDGNSDNNVRENLRLLCANCHALQPTHRGRNVGKHGNTTRKKIMSRYGSYR